MRSTTKLRELLKKDGILVAPGAYDGLTAMLVQEAGFPAVYMTGAGVSATHGLPDYGLLTETEMSARAGILSHSVQIPVLADADTGYGNELNVTRTVAHYEQAGVAALQIEDQVSPKRCGHLAGKEVVSREDYLAKIRAAVAAKTDPDLVIIARSDARGVISLDEAVDRVNAALKLGADIAFVEALTSAEEAAQVPKRVNGPCLINMVIGGMTPVLNTDDAQSMGFKVCIQPGILFHSYIAHGRELLSQFKATHQHPPVPGDLTIEQVFEAVGSKKWDALRAYPAGSDRPTTVA